MFHASHFYRLGLTDASANPCTRFSHISDNRTPAALDSSPFATFEQMLATALMSGAISPQKAIIDTKSKPVIHTPKRQSHHHAQHGYWQENRGVIHESR